MKNKKIITILGARPQFIKAAALTRLLKSHNEFSEILVHTGQHFDQNMSDIFFKELSIPNPHYNLGIHDCTHGQMTGRMLEKIEEILLKEQPKAVVVYGDTNSTLAGALATSKLHIPVIHVEAGLRSYNKKMPEEQNRIIADHLSTYLFCPTKKSIENLKKENITHGVFNTGDIMYDATLYALNILKEDHSLFERLKITSTPYATATIHRAENTDDPKNLANIITYLENEALKQPIILPLHPRTKHRINQLGLTLKNIQLIEPLGYFDMQKLLSKSNLVLTDSGGLQKEAYFHQKPCITLRTETEWVELIENGWNRLWTEPHYKDRKPILDYGQGDASQKMVQILEQVL